MPTAEVVGPADISPLMLQSLYETSGIQTSIDSDGDLAVTTSATCYVFPTEAGDRIQLTAFLSTDHSAAQGDLLDFANRVNNRYSTVRARVTDKGTLAFDYHIPVDGGVTPRAIVLATRFFLDVAVAAIRECDTEGLVT